MKLFCKCPLPKVGSDDWPWEYESETAQRKVKIPKGCKIPEEFRKEGLEVFEYAPVDPPFVDRSSSWARVEGDALLEWIARNDIKMIGDHGFEPPSDHSERDKYWQLTPTWIAKHELTATVDHKLTRAEMPGYVAEEVLLDTFETDGCGILKQGRGCRSSYRGMSYTRGSPCLSNAKSDCEQDARQQWVRQNLLTMEALDIGHSDASDECSWGQRATGKKAKSSSRKSKLEIPPRNEADYG